MTPDQAAELRRIASCRDWCRVPIDRSGGSKALAAARQQLARKGLLETHPERRFVWRATPAGREALAGLES